MTPRSRFYGFASGLYHLQIFHWRKLTTTVETHHFPWNRIPGVMWITTQQKNFVIFPTAVRNKNIFHTRMTNQQINEITTIYTKT